VVAGDPIAGALAACACIAKMAITIASKTGSHLRRTFIKSPSIQASVTL
jgi:hypothetical protein